MDKLTMAHQFAMMRMQKATTEDYLHGVSLAWAYADAMQAEADKRKEKGVPDALLTRDENGNCAHFHTTLDMGECFDCGKVLKVSNSTPLEWQPDWSVAPSWANWWAFDGFSEKANWFKTEPYLDDDSLEDEEDDWNISDTYKEAPSFNYQGNWRNSLRKRPVID